MEFSAAGRDYYKKLFGILEKHWIEDPRDGYRKGMNAHGYTKYEQEAVNLLAKEALEQGFQVFSDLAGNLYVYMEGKDPNAKAIVMGSHVDSVRGGGRYDGRSGVVAGLTTMKMIKDSGEIPPQGLCTMICRCEESDVYGQVSIGAKLALNDIDLQKLLTLVNNVDGQTLLTHMLKNGIDTAQLIDAIKARDNTMFPVAECACFLEIHPEQAASLRDGVDTPEGAVGMVDGIRGNIRFNPVTFTGRAGHSGALEQIERLDANRISAHFTTRFYEEMGKITKSGKDAVYHTRQAGVSATSGFTTISDKEGIAIEVRSVEIEVLNEVKELLERLKQEVEEHFKVKIGPATFKSDITIPKPTLSKPAQLNNFPAVRDALDKAAGELGVKRKTMKSGAGHDAAVFANAGVPTGFLFVRDIAGESHVPHELIDFESFENTINIAHRFAMTGLEPSRPTNSKHSFTDRLLAQGASRVRQ